ncbi:MAG: hypothetical protein GDA55_00870 [Cellvibrionales bacterium]|nr:hypothetical protein [Cellvibrionales bacterium]
MKTQKESYDKGWQSIRASMAEHREDYRTALADLKIEIAKRDKDNQRFLITLFAILIATLIGISEFRIPDIPSPQSTQITHSPVDSRRLTGDQVRAMSDEEILRWAAEQGEAVMSLSQLGRDEFDAWRERYAGTKDPKVRAIAITQ